MVRGETCGEGVVAGVTCLVVLSVENAENKGGAVTLGGELDLDTTDRQTEGQTQTDRQEQKDTQTDRNRKSLP